MIGLIVTVPLFVALAPDRLRLIPVGAVLAGATLLAIGPIYEVYDVATAATSGGGDDPVGPVLDRAVTRIFLVCLLAGVCGVVLAVLDLAVRPGAAAIRRTRRAVAVLAALAGLVLAGAALASAGEIRNEVESAWRTFKSGTDTPARPGARFTTAYSDQRYDYFTVAFDAFEERPLVGIGVGGYEHRYTRDRGHEKPSRYVHNLWLRVLAELGVVGFVLLDRRPCDRFRPGGLDAATTRRGPSGRDRRRRCSSAYFFVHSSFDWIEEFPALASPAFALPLVALVVARPVHIGRPAGRSQPRRAAGRALALAGFVAAAVALAPAYLASRYDDRAARMWTANPEAAFEDLDQAARLDPLSARPELRAGTLAVDLGAL